MVFGKPAALKPTVALVSLLLLILLSSCAGSTGSSPSEADPLDGKTFTIAGRILQCDSTSDLADPKSRRFETGYMRMKNGGVTIETKVSHSKKTGEFIGLSDNGRSLYDMGIGKTMVVGTPEGGATVAIPTNEDGEMFGDGFLLTPKAKPTKKNQLIGLWEYDHATINGRAAYDYELDAYFPPSELNVYTFKARFGSDNVSFIGTDNYLVYDKYSLDSSKRAVINDSMDGSRVEVTLKRDKKLTLHTVGSDLTLVLKRAS